MVAASQDGDRIRKQFLCNIWMKLSERPNVGDVSIKSRTVLSLERATWLMAKRPKRATKEYPAPPKITVY